jgi:hypothetical protein
MSIWHTLIKSIVCTSSLPTECTLNVPSSEPGARGRYIVFVCESHNFVAVRCMLKLACIEVEMNESCSVCAATNLEETVLGSVKA